MAFAVACGGHDSKAAKSAEPSGHASTAAKAGSSGEKSSSVPTRKQLDGAGIKSGDVSGWEVSVPKSPAGPIGGHRMVADKPACQPVADALSESGAVNAVASVERSAVAKDRSGVMVRIRLASYSSGGADKVMAGLSNADTNCKGFIGSTGNGQKQHVGVAEYDGYLTAQSNVTLRLTAKIGQQTLPVYLDVGRVGDSVEYFTTFNVMGDDPGTGSTTAQVQQHVKLSAVH